MILLENVTFVPLSLRFNQRYYTDLPSLSSFLAVLWWMCCYRMMYVYRLWRITAVLKSYSFASHHRKCLCEKISQGFQVCLSISLSTTHDKCAAVRKGKKGKKKNKSTNFVSRLFLTRLSEWQSSPRSLTVSGKMIHVSLFPLLFLRLVALHASFTVTTVTSVKVILLIFLFQSDRNCNGSINPIRVSTFSALPARAVQRSSDDRAELVHPSDVMMQFV